MSRRFRNRHSSEDANLEMTPMIDVVFQLIIFFIVTINLEQRINEDIKLPDGPNSYKIESMPNTMVIEVSERGWLSMHGVPLSKQDMKSMITARSARIGEFPVLIRGDSRTEHRYIRSVMDMCAEAGIWRLNFVAIQERKGG